MSDVASVNAIVVIPVVRRGGGRSARVVAAARAHAPVVVVDDGSRDGSAEVAPPPAPRCCAIPRRLGKAQALLTGVAAARRRGAASIVTLDGDGQHDAGGDSRAAGPRAGHVRRTVIVGNRLDGPGTLPLPRAATRSVWPASSPAGRAGCRCATRSRASASTRWRCSTRCGRGAGGFVFETEILLAAAARGWAVEEVPVAALPRAAPSAVASARVRDGVAIGSFLAGRVGARWAREGRTVAGRRAGASSTPTAGLAPRRDARSGRRLRDSPAGWSAAFVTPPPTRRRPARACHLAGEPRTRRGVGRGRGGHARGADDAAAAAAPGARPARVAPTCSRRWSNAVYGDGRAAADAGDANVRMAVRAPSALAEGP